MATNTNQTKQQKNQNSENKSKQNLKTATPRTVGLANVATQGGMVHDDVKSESPKIAF